jgi:predicted phosphate transport protein (TIGR00153 family)
VPLFTRSRRNGVEYFNLFDEAGANILRAAELLDRLLHEWPDEEGLEREILICEQEGDRITHDVIQLLNHKIATPIDREDVYALASALDDIVDYTEEAADVLGLYNIEAPMVQAQQLSVVLRDACRNLSMALSRLHEFGDLHHQLVEVNRLENEGDRITREALASLFVNGIDPMIVIRWKDIFERIEQAIDACETAANIMETILVKHA